MNLEDIRDRCTEDGSCWIWKHGVGGRGSGPQMRFQGKNTRVRRVVCFLKNGRWPEMTASKCGHPLCVSPKCIVESNAKRRGMTAKPRSPAANRTMAETKRAQSKFTAEDIARVREAASTQEAAEAVGMSIPYARAIRAGDKRVDYSNPFAGLMA